MQRLIRKEADLVDLANGFEDMFDNKMTESPLEVQRRLHEERERIICAMVRESLRTKNSYKERVNSEHRLKVFVDQYLESTLRLKDVYVDEDGLRKAEINAVSGPNEFAEFYTRFRRLKEAHRNAPNEIVIPLSVEFQRFTENGNDLYQNDADLVEFTDEEGYGRFLDLHECYDKFINLKGVERVDYITYINTFDDVQSIPKSKKNAEYRAYLGFLMDYLVDVIARVKPLLDISEDLVKAEQEFENQWEEGTFPGWPKESVSALSHSGAFLDLTPFQTVEELKTVGLNRLKSALMALGLKCGGTLDERAQRLFSTKGKTADEIESSLFAKTSAAEQMKRERDRQKEIAKMEAQLAYFAQQVEDLRKATRENVERKQARVFGEYEEDEEEIGNISDEQEEEDIPYNPKNLPLGWDGKPIPYWLYKLHGLNLSFPCEICGNQVYKGPKAFQKHFSEWRHAHGMRCLGIPNTAHFANITSISDALDLWNKLREEKESVRFKAEVEEEYEDSLGNVVNKKTYEDLRRQGLL